MKVGTSCVYPSPPGKPVPEPPNDDGTCPPGFHPVSNGAACVMDPVPPDDGQCPAGTHMVNGQCVWNGGVLPPGPGGDGGDGDGDGDGESGFGGNCESGFSCEGDAIQCAIAKQQHIRACQLFDNESAESKLYNEEKAKDKNRDVTKDLPGNETIDIGSKLRSDNLLGGATCISDLSVTVVGFSVTLPMSKVCPVLGYLGWILVAVASLAAFRIMSGTTPKE